MSDLLYFFLVVRVDTLQLINSSEQLCSFFVEEYVKLFPSDLLDPLPPLLDEYILLPHYL